ncbi:MAG: hypothetical protein HYT61_03220 [Candidatus Yanofskybacteria bacterium]|nr:hypothetical protein [Candidatus Yanofskybacteria bacterium]
MGRHNKIGIPVGPSGQAQNARASAGKPVSLALSLSNLLAIKTADWYRLVVHKNTTPKEIDSFKKCLKNFLQN